MILVCNVAIADRYWLAFPETTLGDGENVWMSDLMMCTSQRVFGFGIGLCLQRVALCYGKHDNDPTSQLM